MTERIDAALDPAAVTEAQERVLAACMEMIGSGLITGTWGMACMRVQDDFVVVTPSGMKYSALAPSDLPVVDLGGRVVLGRFKPTTETPMLTRLMRKRPEIAAVAHTHSTTATGFAAAGRAIPVVLAELAEAVGGAVPCAAYARFGTPELADEVLAVAGGVQAVLLRNHGVVTFGPSVEEAASTALVVEEGARVALVHRQLGANGELDAAEVAALREIHLTRYGQR